MSLRTAILGSGNIGADVLAKVLRSSELTCELFVGQRAQSPALLWAKGRSVRTSDRGAAALFDDLDAFDLVFDATSAMAHLEHAARLEASGKTVVNLTPAALGTWCVPALGGTHALGDTNINMITCGGQASIPIGWALRQGCSAIDVIEAVSSISARSAGPATRRNVDEYLGATERALAHFSGAKHAKAILNINPADPPVSMQTTVMAIAREPDLDRIRGAVREVVERIKTYAAGYELLVEPRLEGERLVTVVRVTGAGDYLPSYAGNLDIITCAAVRAAEDIAKRKREEA